MFFNDILVNCESLRKVWRVGNRQEVETDDSCLPELCQKIDNWVGSEHTNATKRMSLRTSAVLVNGAANIYKKEMERVLRDTYKLDQDIVTRKRRKSVSVDDVIDTTDNTSQSKSTPEQMMRQTVKRTETISSPIIGESSLQKLLADYPCSSDDISPSFTRQSYKIQQGSDVSTPENSTEKSDTTKFSDGSTNSSEREFNNHFCVAPHVPGNSTSDSEKDDTINNKPKSGSENQSPYKRPKPTDNVFAITDSEGDSSKAANVDLNKSFIETNEDTDRFSDEIERGDTSTNTERSVILVPSVIRNLKTQEKEKDSRRSYSRRDQGTQTSIPLPSRNNETRESEYGMFDKTLPFGHLLVYDSIESRIPSKIVISSLNLNRNI